MSRTEKPLKPARLIKKKRTKKAPQYKSFRLAKKIKLTHRQAIPGIYRLSKESIGLLFNNKKLFFGIVLIHIVLSLVFVTGISLSFDFLDAKNELQNLLGSETSQITTSLALFGFLISSGNSSTSEAGGVYQVFLTLLLSLVLIWSIRQIYANQKPSIKQAFYQGVYPLVPFILVLLVVLIQLLPFLLGSFLLATVFGTGLAITALEKLLWLILFLLLTLLTLYMIISSIFALYIVTLPNMTPLKALRSARGLVLHRRVSVGLRIVGLPIITLILLLLILLPLIYLLPTIAVIVFICLSSLALYFVHGYMYNLYKSLL